MPRRPKRPVPPPPGATADGPTGTGGVHPGIQLAASLLLICLFFLPLAGGGYSGAGYQLGFVLLPLAAALALWMDRGLFSGGTQALAILAFVLTALAAMVSHQPGWILWYYLLHLLTSWLLARAVWRAAPQHASLVLPVATTGALLTALYGWFLWYGAGRLDYSITSTFGLHNAYGGFLLLAWPLAAITALEQAGTRGRLGWALASLFLAVTLVLTYSKASIACLILQIVFFLAATGLRGLLARAGAGGKAVLWGGLVALLGLLALPTVRQALAMMLDFNSYSMQGRLRFWQAALEMFRDHPLLGVGLGKFGVAYPQYQQDWLFYSNDPHSWLLQLPAELGLGGALIGLLALAGTAIWLLRLHRAGRRGTAALRLRLAFAAAAVLGSLAHAAFDFDYTFGATVALLGLALAYGSWRAGPETASPDPGFPPPGEASLPDLIRMALCAGLILAGLYGESYTLERFTLDRLRDGQLSAERQEQLLRGAIRSVPGNYRTHHQLAALLAQTGAHEAAEEARQEIERSLLLEPRYAPAWALKGLLAKPPQEGDADLARAIELDHYNFPEHYVYWARAAEDDTERLRRLELGMQRIGVEGPVEPDHPRPQWFGLNPLFVTWYEEMARLTTAERDRELYEGRAKAIREYIARLRAGQR